jgi:hypothetical protein
LTYRERVCSIATQRRRSGGPAWSGSGCTILIIVCLGGGKRLALVILGAMAIGGAAVLLGNVPEGGPGMAELAGPGLAMVLVIAAFVAVMKVGMRTKAKYPDSWW